jgi:hypothetical protein
MRAAALVLALAVGLTAVPAAGAATVQVGATGAVDYAAAPGELNDVQASASGTTVTIADAGAPITPGPGCTATGARAATCTVEGFPRLSAALGDGDDTAAASGLLAAVLDGGAGDDTLTGGDAPDLLEGGPGADTLHGGPGDDTLHGDGAGLVSDPSDDRLDGGAGADTIDCGDGSADVVTAGEASDDVANCEQTEQPAPVPPSEPPSQGPTPPGPAQEQEQPQPQPQASPVDPGMIAPLQAPAPRAAPAKATVPVTLRLRVASRIARTTLRARGLRATVAASVRSQATLRLLRGTHTLARRSLAASPTPRAVHLRSATRAGTLTLRVTAPGVTTQTRRVRVTR